VVLFEWDHHVGPWFVADNPCDVAAAASIVRQHNIAGSKSFDRANAGFNFDLTGKGDYVLTFRRWMKVIQMVRRRPTKQDTRGGLQLGSFGIAVELEIDINLFEVRLVIGTGKNSCDLHEDAL
jgi:hypothetical protein